MDERVALDVCLEDREGKGGVEVLELDDHVGEVLVHLSHESSDVGLRAASVGSSKEESGERTSASTSPIRRCRTPT